MQPDSKSHDDWLEKAVHDLQAATAILEYYEAPPTDTVCYHCHQVAEKALKAFLIMRSASLPYIHDLVGLLNMCSDLDSTFGRLKDPLVVLNQYYIEAKYPLDEPIQFSREEAEDPRKLAEQVLTYVQERMK